MTIPQVVDGVTDADAAFMNQLVDAANQANAAFNGAGQITTAAITPALEEAYDDPSSVLGSLRASADGIQDGTLPIALAGIEGALGAWADTPESPGRGQVNAMRYGASPDVADNIPYINAAIDACFADGGGTVYVPTHKVFPVRPSGTSNRIELQSGVTLDLLDARLKVATDTPSYQTLCCPAGGPATAISRSGIRGGEIDHDPANSVYGDANAAGLHTWLSYAGDDLKFDGVRIVTGGRNAIHSTGVSVRRLAIRDCEFQFLASAGGAGGYDNSTIYGAALMALLTGNRFWSEHSEQARGAIEVHCPIAIVNGNESHNYETFVNLVPKDSTSWFTSEVQTGHIVTSNIAYGARNGIMLWPLPDFTWSQIDISHNVIDIAQLSADVRSWNGIGWVNAYDTNGVVADVAITDNLIRFEAGDDRVETADETPLSYASSSAITTAARSPVINGRVSRNTVVDCPLTAMRIGNSLFPGASHDNVAVDENVFVNCGRNRSWNKAQRAVLFLAGEFTRTRIDDNVVVVTDAEGSNDQDLTYIAGTLTSGGQNEINNHRVYVNGGYTLAEATDPATFRYDRAVPATTLGTVTGKREMFDQYGASVGFVPIYDAIT